MLKVHEIHKTVMLKWPQNAILGIEMWETN